jgi:hypothetical protein
VVFGPQDRQDPTLLFVHVDERVSDAWRAPQIDARIQDIIAGGGKIELHVGERVVQLPR